VAQGKGPEYKPQYCKKKGQVCVGGGLNIFTFIGMNYYQMNYFTKLIYPNKKMKEEKLWVFEHIFIVVMGVHCST
jgi:hypothetical protein